SRGWQPLDSCQPEGLFAGCAESSERPFSSSPRDAGAGRGPRRGASKVPPLPGPLLHPMEERESLWFRLGPAERQRAFAFPLIELIFVTAILAIAIRMALPSLKGFVRGRKRAS